MCKVIASFSVQTAYDPFTFQRTNEMDELEMEIIHTQNMLELGMSCSPIKSLVISVIWWVGHKTVMKNNVAMLTFKCGTGT